MQIKFRCQYCQQLLGISKSRAGARVDCPGCGRTINVPGDATSVAQPQVDESATDRDNSLDDALASLILLSESGNKSRPKSASSVKSSPPSEQGQESPESLIPDFDEAAVVIRELANEAPNAGSAGPATRGNTASFEAAAPRTSRGTPIVITVLLCVVSFAVGGGTMEAWLRLSKQESTSSSDSAAQRDQDVLEMLREVDKDAAPREAAAAQNQSSGDHQVIGVVRWVTDAGKPEPDSQALVLLVPRRESAGLRFDGRSLREPSATIDQKALRSALREFGVTFARTGPDGRFELERTSAEKTELIVVSRHRSRPEGVDVPPAVAEALGQYFDSGLSFVGQLAVATQTLPAMPTSADSETGTSSGSTAESIEITIERN